MTAKPAFFALFLVSGFCSLVYEVVWLRLAMASFGVTTPMVSIVLSVFMAGLALGSWGAGRIANRLAARSPALLLRMYGAAEVVIGASGVLVPFELTTGRSLLSTGGSVAWGSTGYYLASGGWTALALLPACVAMGATFPLAIGATHSATAGGSEGAFSRLYLANVLGAALGCLISAFLLIEMFGFRRTALLTAGLNALLAICAFALAPRIGSARDTLVRRRRGSELAISPASRAKGAQGAPGTSLLILLFSTGLASMALELVWTRLFTVYLGTVVYSFATVLAVYLGATFAGSALYRRTARRTGLDSSRAVVWAGVATGIAALAAFIAADPRLPLRLGAATAAVRTALAVLPISGVLGFLTPLLVDAWSGGEPSRVGTAYAVNVIGCIVGPLVAAFVLLPLLGETAALLTLCLGLLTLSLLPSGSVAAGGRPARRWALLAACALAFSLAASTRTYVEDYPRERVLRDHTATVIVAGEGMNRILLVNGIGMTSLSPITKMMAHLPLAHLDHPPRSMAVICMGMGTTFRSGLSWGIPTTVAELVPSVPRFFSYFHSDASALLRSVNAHVVVDDGRRFLERTASVFDVITVDPPPPIEAAGSSLLYSREFYAAARRRLRPGGILQQWFPGGENYVTASFARAIAESFPHVRAFSSTEGRGIHFLASDREIPHVPAQELASRLPGAAAADLVEWSSGRTPTEEFARVVEREIPMDFLFTLAPTAPVLDDDRPVNEYYFVRRHIRTPQGDGRP